MDEKRSSYWKFVGVFVALVALGLGAFLLSVLLGVRKPPAVPPPVAQPTQPKPDEIVITKLPNGDQLVENRTWGSSLQIPSDWKIDSTNHQFYTPNNYSTQCKISSSIKETEKTKTLDDMRLESEKNLDDLSLTIQNKNYQISKVSDYDALKIYLLTAETGYSTTVRVPVLNKIYSYVLYSDTINSSRCNTFFEKVLQTISIKR